MGAQKHFMPDIIGLLTHYRPEHIAYFPDGTMATPVGFFRPAYNHETKVFALFYARNYEDLADAVIPHPKDAARTIIGIKHPERLLVIATKDREQSEGQLHADIAHPDQPDLSYFQHAVLRCSQYYPRALFREAVLHHIGSHYLSKLFGYGTEQADSEGGMHRIQVFSRLNHGREGSFIPVGHLTTPQMRWRRMLLPSAERTLSVQVEDGELEKPIRQNVFTPEQTLSLILDDATEVVDAIWRRHDPSLLGITTAVARSGEIITEQFADLRATLTSPREIIRFGVKRAMDASDILSAAISFALDQALPEIETPKWISEGGQHLVEQPRKSLVACVSELAELFILPKPDQMPGYAWIDTNPEKGSLPSYMFDRECQAPSKDFLFYNWLISHFRAPYIATADYAGDFDDVSQMSCAADVKAVRISVSNGLTHIYLTETDDLFSFYQNPGYAPYERQLPAGYHAFFKEGTVIHTHAFRYDGVMKHVPYEDFQQLLVKTLGNIDLLNGMSRPAVPPNRKDVMPARHDEVLRTAAPDLGARLT